MGDLAFPQIPLALKVRDLAFPPQLVKPTMAIHIGPNLPSFRYYFIIILIQFTSYGCNNLLSFHYRKRT